MSCGARARSDRMRVDVDILQQISTIPTTTSIWSRFQSCASFRSSFVSFSSSRRVAPCLFLNKNIEGDVRVSVLCQAARISSLRSVELVRLFCASVRAVINLTLVVCRMVCLVVRLLSSFSFMLCVTGDIDRASALALDQVVRVNAQLTSMFVTCLRADDAIAAALDAVVASSSMRLLHYRAFGSCARSCVLFSENDSVFCFSPTKGFALAQNSAVFRLLASSRLHELEIGRCEHLRMFCFIVNCFGFDLFFESKMAKWKRPTLWPR